MAPKTAEVQKYGIRGAIRYLEGKGVSISEARMRTLLRQHEIFAKDPETTKGKLADSEVETWHISQTALDKFAEASKSGTVRTSNGAKAWRVNATAEQLASLREWCKANGVAEPVRANKGYTKKSGQPAQIDSDTPVGSDGLNGLMSDDDETEDLFADEPAEVVEQ